MSLSWNSGSRRSLGLSIGSRHLELVEVQAQSGGWLVCASAESDIAAPLFAGPVTNDAMNALASAVQETGKAYRRLHCPVHVSVPDASAYASVIELDELPAGKNAQTDLVRWRMERENAGGPGLTTVCQYLGQAGNKHLLLGIAIDEDWLSCIEETLAHAGMRVWSLRPTLFSVFNRYHRQLTDQTGALVVVSVEAWGVLIWDEQGRARYIRGGWRAQMGSDIELVVEIERVILGFVHGALNRSVSRVFLAADMSSAEFGTALDARLRDPCVRLGLHDGASIAIADNVMPHLSPTALAAALGR